MTQQEVRLRLLELVTKTFGDVEDMMDIAEDMYTWTLGSQDDGPSEYDKLVEMTNQQSPPSNASPIIQPIKWTAKQLLISKYDGMVVLNRPSGDIGAQFFIGEVVEDESGIRLPGTEQQFRKQDFEYFAPAPGKKMNAMTFFGAVEAMVAGKTVMRSSTRVKFRFENGVLACLTPGTTGFFIQEDLTSNDWVVVKK